MASTPTVTPPAPAAPQTEMLLGHLAGGITAVSLITTISYAIVFGFEEGFNAFFQIPADFVATNLLSVFHALTLVVYVLINDRGLLALEAVAAIVLGIVPAFVYSRQPLVLGATAIILYCFSNAFTPIVLLSAACATTLFMWWRCLRKVPRTEDPSTFFPEHGRLLLSYVGQRTMKGFFLFVLLLTPLFYFGYRFAETQTPRLVFQESNETWVIARVLNDNLIMVRLAKAADTVPGCTFQFPYGKPNDRRSRDDRLSRDLRVIKDTDAKPLTWREFGRPLNYCLYPGEKRNGPFPAVVFIRQGPAPTESAP